jgi:hypothetical protein
VSSDYISWNNLSDGGQENLCKSVCERLLAHSKDVADRFTLTKEKWGRKVKYRLESKHKDSSAMVQIHEGDTRWPEKAGVYIKRSDGYGGGQTQTLRFHLKSDESFNIEKAAARACELDQVSIDHAVRRREDKAREEHGRDLKKLVAKELEVALADTAWEVDDSWDSVKLRLDGHYAKEIKVSVSTYSEPTVGVNFPFEAESKANAKLLKQINVALLEVMGVIEGEAFRSAFENKPKSLLTEAL